MLLEAPALAVCGPCAIFQQGGGPENLLYSAGPHDYPQGRGDWTCRKRGKKKDVVSLQHSLMHQTLADAGWCMVLQMQASA